MSKINDILSKIIEKVKNANLFREENLEDTNQDLSQIATEVAGNNGMSQEEILRILKEGQEEPTIKGKGKEVSVQVKGKGNGLNLEVKPQATTVKTKGVNVAREDKEQEH